jgi:hypothetical protein
MIKGDAAGKIATSGAWDEATREAFADRIEAFWQNTSPVSKRASWHARPIRRRILKAMNINLVGGDPYGGSCALDQFFIWRPFAQRQQFNRDRQSASYRRLDPSRTGTWRRLWLPAGQEVGRMNEIKPDANVKSDPLQRLGEIGLSNFAPYLMNRIMGRYNADLRQEMTGLGLTTPKMRALAVLSVIDACR